MATANEEPGHAQRRSRPHLVGSTREEPTPAGADAAPPITLANLPLPDSELPLRAELDNSPPSEEAATANIPEFDSAVQRGAASFTQLASAIFYSKEKFNENPTYRLANKRYIERLTYAFEEKHGQIVHSFFCENVPAAVVLTDRQELCIIPPPLPPQIHEIADLLFECDRLNFEADRVLVGKWRKKDLSDTKTMIYAVVTKLLSLVDDVAESKGRPPPGILELHAREVKHASDYYRRAAERHAQFDYFLGMLIGSAVSAVGLTVIAFSWILLQFEIEFPIGRTLISCVAAGAIGAVISVMSRMTFGDLSLDYEAGRGLLIMLGGFRPVIGMIFGAAMWALSASGVLPIGPKVETVEGRLAFFLLIAFLAGFSERLAQDMLGRSADEIGRPLNGRTQPRNKASRVSKGGKP
jgi:hypothetical protein